MNSNIIDILIFILIVIRFEREYAVYQTGLSDYEHGSAEFHHVYYNNI